MIVPAAVCNGDNVYFNAIPGTTPDANGFYKIQASVHNTCPYALTLAYFITTPSTSYVSSSQSYDIRPWTGVNNNIIISLSPSYPSLTHITTGGADGSVMMAANSRIAFFYYSPVMIWFCPQHVNFANGDGQNIDLNYYNCNCNAGMGSPSVQCSPKTKRWCLMGVANELVTFGYVYFLMYPWSCIVG